MTRRSSAIFLFALGLSARVSAQLIEPNGLTVPITPPGSTETSLQSFFAAQNPTETIDAVKSASAEPSTFSPRCGFKAELVLSQSQSPAGLAWYNVPSDPNGVPSPIYPLLAETTMPGAVISSDQIRSDPNYAGGSIGFALTKFGGKPIYYSEASRNPDCTACSMPGHWKLMLAYASTRAADVYYLAWEDWEGANESSWPDDGDFNDKVFRLSGVRCAGGGEPCDTGKPGVCAQGLSACGSGDQAPACQQLEAAGTDVCDGLDNDCDGDVDEGDSCGALAVCVQGVCTHSCGGAEFGCLGDLVCDRGQCIEAACVGISCQAGTVCHGGQCLAPCQDVVCPLGQSCLDGICKDPCAAVSCQAGSVCRQGVCVESCQCNGCASGLDCEASSGRCLDHGCAGMSCPSGSACAKGQCVDACSGAKCPGDAACANGQCGQPPDEAMSAPYVDAGTLIPARSFLPDGGVADGGGAASSARNAHTVRDCSCRIDGGGSGGFDASALLMAAAAWSSRRKHRR